MPFLMRFWPTLWMLAAQQLTLPSERDLGEIVSLARTAVQLGQADPETLCISAHIIALAGGDMPEGIAIVDLALELNPNSADAGDQWYAACLRRRHRNRHAASA